MSARRVCRCVWLPVFAALLPALRLVAQAPNEATIRGVVQGTSWLSLARGAVTLTSVDEASPDRARTEPLAADSTFLFPNLEPGIYTISLDLPGSSPLPSQPVTVLPGQNLEVVAIRSTAGIRVVATPADVAADEPDADDDDEAQASARGLTVMQNATLLDGANLTQSFNAVAAGAGSDPAPDPDGDPDSADRANGPANGLARGRHAGIAYLFSQSSVREFRVAGQGYSAQAGGAGAVSTMVSRAGTDRFHGSASFVLRSQLLAASSPLATATTYANGVVTSLEVKPHDLRENFGGAVGGPLPKVRGLFFFEAIDKQLRGFPAIASPEDSDFYNLTAIQKALLAVRGVSAAATEKALDYLSSLTGSTPRRADQTLNFARLDWRPRPSLRFSVEDNTVRWNAPAGLIDAPTVARGRASIGNAAGSLDAVVFRATKTLGRHRTLEARASWVEDIQYETPQTPLAQEPAIAPGGLAPEVNISPDGLLFGTPASLSQKAYPDERRWQFGASATIASRHHLFAVGGEFSLVNDRVATLANAAGTFRYDSGVTGGYDGGLVDFITDYTFNINAYPNGGCPSITASTHLFCFRSYSQSFGESTVAFSTQEWAGFAEDTWRPARRLVLHAGCATNIRYCRSRIRRTSTWMWCLVRAGRRAYFPRTATTSGRGWRCRTRRSAPAAE